LVLWERANSKAWQKSDWKRVAMFPNCIIVRGVRVKTGVHRQRGWSLRMLKVPNRGDKQSAQAVLSGAVAMTFLCNIDDTIYKSMQARVLMDHNSSSSIHSLHITTYYRVLCLHFS
jgi:hypothetical protein